MLVLKDNSIKPEFSQGMLYGLIVADQVYDSLGIRETVVTSGKDGVHSSTSLHYSGNAVDLRTRDRTRQEQEAIRDELRRRLNEHYDVVLESDHLHLEYQPRSP